MDLSTLRRESEAVFVRLAEVERDARLGLPSSLDIPSIFKPFPSLSTLEAYACAAEQRLPSGQPDLALLDASATTLELARTASLDATRAEFGATAHVLVEGEPVPLRQVRGRLANEGDREVRARLARASDTILGQVDAPLARRLEVCQELAASLGFASYEALRTRVTGVDLAALATTAEATLAATDDAWRDLLGFGLRRTVGRVQVGPRGDASAHDLVRFGRLAACDDVFRGQRLRATLESFLQAIGLADRQAERVELNLASRAEGAAVLAFRIPFEIAVEVGRIGGGADYLRAFGAVGIAHHRAGTDPDLAPEQRRLGDLACAESFGALFSRLLADEGFLRRYLDADSKDALEAARLVAIDLLGGLRRQCAALLYQRVLWAQGAQRELRGLYRDLHRRALGVDWPVEPWLWDVEPRFLPAARLRGMALGSALADALRDLANEDWWRNPRTGGLLTRVASRGGLDSAETVAKELGGELSLVAAARRLVEVAAR